MLVGRVSFQHAVLSDQAADAFREKDLVADGQPRTQTPRTGGTSLRTKGDYRGKAPFTTRPGFGKPALLPSARPRSSFEIGRNRPDLGHAVLGGIPLGLYWPDCWTFSVKCQATVLPVIALASGNHPARTEGSSCKSSNETRLRIYDRVRSETVERQSIQSRRRPGTSRSAQGSLCDGLPQPGTPRLS